MILANILKPFPVVEFITKMKDNHYGNHDFYIFIQDELELIKSVRSKGTIDNYHNLINKMKEWKPTLSFNEITLEYIQRFHDNKLKAGNQLSTNYKKHGNFKFLLGLAQDKEYINKNPFTINLRLRKSPKHRITTYLLKKNLKHYNKPITIIHIT